MDYIPDSERGEMMGYDVSSLKRLNKESHPKFNLRATQSATLILIRGDGRIEWARTVGDKDKMVSSVNWETDVLLWPWVGQYKTDLFLVDKQDLEDYYNRKGVERNDT